MTPLNDTVKHKLCHSKYEHIPGPDNSNITQCIELSDLNDDKVIDISSHVESDYNLYYAIHSGMGSAYDILLIEGNNDPRPRTTNKKIGHKDFVKGESVVLEIVPMYGPSEIGRPSEMADFGVYWMKTGEEKASYRSPCGFRKFQAEGGPQVLDFTAEKVKDLLDPETGRIPLKVNLKALENDKEYVLTVIGTYNGYSSAYEPIRIVSNKYINGIDVTPPPDLTWLWILIAITAIIVVVIVLVYIFIWRPRELEKKQYKEINEKNEGKAEAIAVEEDNNDPLA